MADPRVQAVRDAVLANPVAKLGSLFIALVAWMYVQGGQITEAKVRVPVDWQLPRDLSPVEPLPQTVSVLVSGSRSATRRAQRGEASLTADLSAMDAGEHTVDLASFDLSGLTGGVSVGGFAPSSVRVVLDERAVRKVRVRPTTVGDPAAGFAVHRTSVEPAVVEIRGPRAALADVFEVATRPIDVSTLAADLEEPVALDLPFGLERAGGAEIRAKVDIEALVESRTLEGVPLLVRNPAYLSATATVAVVLQGPKTKLRSLRPEDITAFVELPDGAKAQRFEVGYGPTSGARVRVVYPDMDELQVVSIHPAVLEVQRP